MSRPSFPFLRNVLVLTALFFVFSANPALAGTAKGTLTHPKGTLTLKFAYLIKGPDAFDNKKVIRRVIFTAGDIGGKISACATLSCVDGALTEGLAIDLDAGPRINYWMVLNNSMVQFSGTSEPTALKVSADEPKRLAGKLTLDGSGMGGPKVDAEFDAPLLKEFTQVR